MDLFSDHIKLDDLAVVTRLFNESRTGFLKLFNNSPVCMSMTTTNLGKRTYVRVNNRFLEKFGYRQEEIIGRTSIEVGILDEEESLRVGRIIKEKGRLQNDYVKCIAKDGTIVHTVSSIEFMEINGETHLISFFIDITKITEQQAIIEQHMQQLEAVNKELEAFSYSVSHDLRAPLRAIHTFTQILEEEFPEAFNDESRKIFSVVKQNTEKMGNLIDHLMDFAKLGKRPIEKRHIDMEALVNEVLIDLKRDLRHNANVQTGVLYPVTGDPSLIRQVMINLVSNAIKYSSKKESPLIEINSEQQPGCILYRVKDNGEGFDMKHAGKLFGVFQRLHTEQEFEGTGVGLATVARIISKHGGTITPSAEKGKGAVFSFTLPE